MTTRALVLLRGQRIPGCRLLSLPSSDRRQCQLFWHRTPKRMLRSSPLGDQWAARSLRNPALDPAVSGKQLKEAVSDAESIFMASIGAANPFNAVQKAVQLQPCGRAMIVQGRSFDLESYDRILLVGAGKAAVPMAAAVLDLLPRRMTAGAITTKYGHSKDSDGKPWLAGTCIHITEAGHPVLDEQGHQGTRRMLELLRGTDARTLVICVISGGGSALLVSPVPSVSFADKQQASQLLLESGASISEMNTIRKHLSLVKGGQLARAAQPATVVSLIFSDVIGDPLDVIASGPTVADPSTFDDCLSVLRKYSLEERMPASVLAHIQAGSRGEDSAQETLSQDELHKSLVHNFLVGNNSIAVAAAEAAAKAAGYNTMVLSTLVEGEAKEVAKVLAAIGKQLALTGQPLPTPACVIIGGETTVTIPATSTGKGGRNQEIALAAAMELGHAVKGPIVVLSGGTDGTDGPTDAAGAVAHTDTVLLARERGLEAQEYLRNHDAYTFFSGLPTSHGPGLLVTGPTGTNVMDVALVIVP